MDHNEVDAALLDLLAALGEHVVDIERRIAAVEAGAPAPKPIAASDLRRITKKLMILSLKSRGGTNGT
ncbi:MAG: hypothetical protein GIW95_11980 [Candidatus Eremiobacteraeota bacterium]|nr:hypothetical protein [Candidatus Eremiobacteraeota bacterium]